MGLIGKRTSKVTKEKQAIDLYKDLTDQQKADLHTLLGKILCGDVKNFYSTKLYKNITESLDKKHSSLVSYVCQKAKNSMVFENVEDFKI